MFNEVEAYINAHGLTMYDGSHIRPEGLNVVNPARNFDGNPNLPRTQYFRQDLPQVAKADIIVLLPGYEKSKWHGPRDPLRAGDRGVVLRGHPDPGRGWMFMESELRGAARVQERRTA